MTIGDTALLKEDVIRRNNEIKEKFLDLDRPIDPKYKLKEGASLYGYIYCIENVKNNKKYIGATYSLWTDVGSPNKFAQLRKRASSYIYEFNRALDMKTSMKKVFRPVIQAMIEDGIENFVFYPIAETTVYQYDEAEKYFIGLYKTLTEGYNVAQGGNTPRGVKKPPMSVAGKISRSEPIIAFNLNHKKIIYADSMKLFADEFNTTKDMIKNTVRKGCQYKGWYIFYRDWAKRDNLINDMLNKNGVFAKMQISDKARAFCKEFHENISIYLAKSGSGLFFDYEIKHIEYEE